MSATIYDTEDLSAIRSQTRRFVEQKVLGKGDEWEEAGMIPEALIAEMGSIGFYGLRVPEEHGGIGMGELASVVLAEELARGTYGGFTATAIVHTDLAMPYLLNYGSDEQKKRWLPDMLTGDIFTAIGVTEPDAGSDVGGMRTTATRDGDGWRLNGSKLYITNGGIADLLFIASKTNSDVKSSRGISIFAVPSDTEGFAASRKLDKMGWRCSNTAELSFDDAWVSDDNVIGDLNKGFYYIMNNFQNERLVLGAMAVGEAQTAIDITLDWVKNRIAFGAPLWEKQAIRQRLAMAAAEVQAARQLVYHAGWLMEQGHDAVKEVSMVKSYVGELVNRVLYDCVQFHGGMGYLRESAIERMYRDARIHSIGGGATEVMLEEIAKRM